MLHEFIDPVLLLVKNGIASWGYPGIILMMAIESANVPLPSEVIMPAAGVLVQQGQMNIHLAALAGAIGCLLGSVPSYVLGRWGGRRFLQKYGRFLLLREDDIVRARHWVERHGVWAFFLCRMLPVVRTFISLPAGVLKADFRWFSLFTFVGSLIWCYALVWLGIKFGENIEVLTTYWHKFDIAVVAMVAIAVALYVFHRIKGCARSNRDDKDQS